MRSIIARAARKKPAEGAGIETGGTSSRIVADGSVNAAKSATEGDDKGGEASALSALATAPDQAIRVAAKLATDAGDLARARALFDLLDLKPSSTPMASVTLIGTARKPLKTP